MRTVTYTYYDFAGEVSQRALLSDFFLTLSRLILHGVIAPFAVTNEVLKSGRDGGGMGPGYEWEPFEISRKEYASVTQDLQSRTDRRTLMGPPGKPFESIVVDDEFHGYRDWFSWMVAVTRKYTGRVIDIPEDS